MVHRLSINKLLVLFVTTFIFCSCLSLQNYDYQYVECQETPKEAINIAIADYSKKHLKQKNNGDVRAVDVHINYTSTDWFYISMVPWIGEVDKYPISLLKKNEGRIPPDWVPTECVEINNVLYVWHNPNVVLTTDVIEKLKKYNLIAKAEDEGLTSLDGTRVCYIFCKTNYKKRYYRKVTVHYNTPLPSCRCSKIGLTGTASDLSLFQQMVSPFTSGGNTSPLSVSIIGNPQCYRAADKAKGWSALFCK